MNSTNGTKSRTRKLIVRNDGLFQLQVRATGYRNAPMTRSVAVACVDRLFSLGEMGEREALTLRAELRA